MNAGEVRMERPDGREAALVAKMNESWRQARILAWECCRNMDRERYDLEIVAGYLAAASEDALDLALMMQNQSGNLRKIALMAEVATASHERFQRAKAEWLKRCAV